MTDDPARQVANLRAALEVGDRGGSDADREALLAFSDRLGLLAQDYTDHRHDKLLRHCTIISENAAAELADAPTDREAAEAVVRWIHAEYDNPETNRDYRSALRTFGRRLAEADGSIPTDIKGIPESLSWVSTSHPSSYDPSPDPAAMLRWDADVKPMIDAAANPRDAALVATAFDSGARSGELRALRVGDVSDAEYGLRIRVDGKTGQRSVTLVPAEPYLSTWLGDHPSSGDDAAPLWSKLGEPTGLSYRRFIDVFKACASRAGVDKPVTPTAFRKSNASWLARQGANAALIEDRQGRARNSEAVARYVARFGEADEQRQYAALHGLEVAPTGEESLAPIECQRCGRETPHDEPMCVWCGRATNVVAAETADRVRSSIRTAMAREPDAGKRAAYLEGLEKLDTNPEYAADLLESVLKNHSD